MSPCFKPEPWLKHFQADGTLFHHEDPLQDCGDRGMFRSFSTFVLFRGNAADEPPLKEVAKEKHFQSFNHIEDIAPAKEAKQTNEEPHKPPKLIRKEPKLSSRGGGNVNAKPR